MNNTYKLLFKIIFKKPMREKERQRENRLIKNYKSAE